MKGDPANLMKIQKYLLKRAPEKVFVLYFDEDGAWGWSTYGPVSTPELLGALELVRREIRKDEDGCFADDVED